MSWTRAFGPGTPGAALLLPTLLLALVFVGLGLVPWSRVGTPWRPSKPALEAQAAAHWDTALIDKAREYRSGGYGRYFFRKGVVGLLLIGLIAFGAHSGLRLLPGRGVLKMTLALVAALAVLDIINIPFGLLAWQKARAVGLSTQGLGDWWLDWAKGILVDWPITALVAGVLFFLIDRFPRGWPLPATLLAAIGGAVMILIVPLVIDPLFNKFTPLTDARLAASFLDLAKQGGVPAREVLVSDASKRTTAVNAYFTGFGPTRRIVVYDTMVEKLTPRESELVLAHEVGHWSHNHIVLGLLLGTIGLGIALLAGAAVYGQIVRNGWFGITGALDPAAVPVILLLYWLGLFLALPIENGISRRFERQADEFALELTRDAATQVSVERSLARNNLPDLVPPPLIETLLYTHPKTLDRIVHAESWAAAHGIPLAPAAVDTPTTRRETP